ncbi:hypothetical protein MKW98_021060 [Papaver atlanticum]|uniref:Leucine-rich repeat-containing N-terminal plant-type domain-containing protein n=1 Tax=Papaver atlanticum TaxID=357466 RepID=A0AAD4T9X7_9MAGN|nr:hypothetical protein MKW98_021060 [Papaver atlanticum]
MEFTSHLAKFNLVLLICFSFSYFQTTKACHETDKAALLDFKKNKIDDGPYKLLKTWNKDTDCCTHWEGVACDDSNGRVVTQLFLAGFLDPKQIYDLHTWWEQFLHLWVISSFFKILTLVTSSDYMDQFICNSVNYHTLLLSCLMTINSRVKFLLN